MRFGHGLGCGIFGFCLFSFPQNEKKYIIFAQFVYLFEVSLFTFQFLNDKMSKTNIFTSRFEGTRREKNKYFAPSSEVENSWTCFLSSENSAQNWDSICLSFLSSSDNWNAVKIGSELKEEDRKKRLENLQLLPEHAFAKVSFFLQCKKTQLITFKNFNILTCFSQFIWFFSLNVALEVR